MDPAMNKSTQLGGTGLFAKMVAKFLVKWIKKTLGLDKGRSVPALSATPSTVEGRPDRDRSRENFGEHRGSEGARANESPQAAQALQGGSFGAHTGGQGPRASEAPAAAPALQGGTYGAHRGTTIQRPTSLPYDQRDIDRRLAAMWTNDSRQRRSAALMSAEPAVLREAGLNNRQIEQAGRGRIPSGYQLSESGPSNHPRYELSRVTPQAQHNCNCANAQIVHVQFGNVSIISLPIGGEQVTVVLGGAAVLAG